LLHIIGLCVIIIYMSSFFTELKRRNVLRVAAAYAVVAWIIIEAGSVLLPTFGASEAAFQIYVLAVLFGFLAALVLAWIFEVTPEGVKLEKNVDRDESVVTQTGRKLDFAIIALLVVALGVSLTLNITDIRNLGTNSASASDRTSIAVLPFDSRSTEAENSLFADGIHDDLLTRLANVRALKVISRTSVMGYRDTTKNIRRIADELGVGTVLVGTVQRVNDNVRINAQLIDATTDETIWSKSYNRKISTQEIFAIQSEISEAITGALRATLTVDEQTRMASVPTGNMGAYSLYTQGRASLAKRRLETVLQARSQFERATELDPAYAEAYSGLADSVLLLYVNHAAITQEEMFTAAGEALDKALALNPDLADAYASLGLLKSTIWGETRSGPELEEAEAAFEKAIELNPNNAQVYMWYAAARSTQEHFEEAIKLYSRALVLDPKARIPYANLPGLYAQMNQNEDALQLYVEAVHEHPEWPTAYQGLAAQLQGMGRFDESIAWGLMGQELSSDPLGGGSMVGSYIEFGEYEKAVALFEGIPEEHPIYAMGAGFEKVMAGEFAAASQYFEDMIAEDPSPRQIMYSIIAGTALLAGDYERARQFTERRFPGFSADADPQIDRFNVNQIVMYAFVLQKLGEGERAAAILAAALPIVRGLPRIGIAGHGIRDVQILALQGREFDALNAMRDAVDEGFRGSLFSDGWPLALDPYLESIRHRAEFQAIIGEIDDAVSLMHDRLRLAEESGDWDSLRAVTERT
jgi:TolB-like protein/tetratricopeptide (TPR) repeat protein